MSDALSKTIPIWCAVLNRLLFEDDWDMQNLQTPEWAVGGSEHAQIEARLDDFVRGAKCLELDLINLRSMLKKPLRPSWVTPEFSSAPQRDINTAYNTVICCTASRRVIGAEASENGYIQGAGDDSEGWSHGLTPVLFWKHKDQLLSTIEEDMPTLIQHLIRSCPDTVNSDDVRLGSTSLYIGTIRNTSSPELYDSIIICSNVSTSNPGPKQEDPRKNGTRILHFLCSDGKLGSRALRSHLPLLLPFIGSLTIASKPPKILLACSTGKDLSVGVALAVLCLFFDDNNNFILETSKAIDKSIIRRRLTYITTAKPDANPSRSTLQSVNAFLMPKET